MPLKREKQENAPRASEEEFISEIREPKRADEVPQGEMGQALSIANKIAEIFLTVPDDEIVWRCVGTDSKSHKKQIWALRLYHRVATLSSHP